MSGNPAYDSQIQIVAAERTLVTEAHAREPSFSVVPLRFNRIPYCNPEHPNSNTLDILSGYDPDVIASQPDFLNHLSATYDDDKAGDGSAAETQEKHKEPTLDLRNPDHLTGMTSHALIHTVTGLLDAGLSNTDCIPYWDREAVLAGLTYQGPEVARGPLEIVDALSMNALRAYCCYLRLPPLEYANKIALIDHGLHMGKRSKQDMRPLLKARKSRLEGDCDVYTGRYGSLYAAKLKHLLWLVDQQTSPDIRYFMRPELSEYVLQASELFLLSPDQLTVDMGVDTGMSANTVRPPYDISMFVQLQHLFKPGQEKIHTIPQDECHRLSVCDLLKSIDRPDRDLPFYEKSDLYRLPFRFDD